LVGLSIEQWHQQFVRQAGWTRGVRSHLYRQAGLWRAETVLDVGCGTGAVTQEVAERTRGRVTGLDLDPAMIGFAAHSAGQIDWLIGDAHCLPFATNSYDVVLCSFLLMWTEEPELAVEEMVRVVREGGVVLATTEPDYGGRVDYPEEIALGPLMEQSVRCDGGHPRIGRRLKAVFSAAGLEVQTGVIASIWDDRQLAEEFEAEWDFIFRTLGNVADDAQLRAYKDKARKALREGARLIFVPNFWALGRKPVPASG
jgi:ubiquinone/menaquinone biosynthesis C-methylase UbiE